MALTLMIRPSHIAPRSVQFDKHTLGTSNWLFSTDNVTFTDLGAANIMFHSIKNDTAPYGFKVLMQPVQNDKLNPV